MSIQRWSIEHESEFFQDDTGDLVTYEDHLATHAYDEAAEIDLFAIAMVQSGRCAAVNVVYDDKDEDGFHAFKAAWDVWKACAMSRAKRFGA